jgi:hypothetical protein
MASLLEKLQQNLGTVAAPAAVSDETGSLQKLLAAKKGIVGGAPGALGPKGLAAPEMAARAATQQQLSQVGQAAQLQSTALTQAAAAQETEQRQKEQALAGQQQESTLRNRIQTENIIRGLEQGRTEMSERERQLGLETVTANLRLQDARYVDNLRREGERARLEEDMSFAEQLQKSIFEDNMALQKLKIKNQSAIDVSDREFEKALASMGATETIRLARENARGEQGRALIGGTTGLASTAIQGVESYKSGGLSSDYQSYKENLPEGTRPMSFTAWQADQTQKASTASKGNTPAVGTTTLSGNVT